jgi:HSP20 family protein
VDGDRLKIAGTREERTREKTDGAVRSEFHYGSFERSLHLPTGARTDAIKATYNSGILEVRIPCDGDEATVTTIPIKTND